MELLVDNRLSVMHLTTDDFLACGVDVPSTEGIINIPLGIATVDVSILLLEPTAPLLDGPIRISLRSKGQIDCARFCEQFGGGGHARAAGMKLPGPLTDAKAETNFRNDKDYGHATVTSVLSAFSLIPYIFIGLSSK